MAGFSPDKTDFPASGAKTLADLMADFENQRGSKRFPAGKLSFAGVGQRDVYNTTAPFQSGGRTVLAGRVEARHSEQSTVIFFEEKTGVWHPVDNAPQFELQDPFITRIGDELLFGGVDFQPDPEGTTRGVWKTVFFKGKSIFDLARFAQGPVGMKDIRLCELGDGQIGLFTRPQGAIGGRGTIGYLMISDLEQLCPQTFTSATLLDDMFAPGEWGGVNEVHLLDDGKLGVLAHIARYETGSVRQYCAAVFTFDPATREYSPLSIIATRDMFAEGPAKRPDLKNVVFSSGLIAGTNASVILYAGVSDTEEHWIELPDMFAQNRRGTS